MVTRFRVTGPGQMRRAIVVRSSAVLLLLIQTGCVLVPKTQLDESQKVAQILRTENARLKDRVLVLTSENRDASDRAVDDAQRLAAQDQAIARLESSVRAYQDDRERLASAVQDIKSNLEIGSRGPRGTVGRAQTPAADRSGSADEGPWSGAQTLDGIHDIKTGP